MMQADTRLLYNHDVESQLICMYIVGGNVRVAEVCGVLQGKRRLCSVKVPEPHIFLALQVSCDHDRKESNSMNITNTVLFLVSFWTIAFVDVSGGLSTPK